MNLGEMLNKYMAKVLIVTKEDDFTYSQKQKDDVKRDFIKLIDKINELTSQRTINIETAEALRKIIISKLK